jgi:hypothetical protein
MAVQSQLAGDCLADAGTTAGNECYRTLICAHPVITFSFVPERNGIAMSC